MQGEDPSRLIAIEATLREFHRRPEQHLVALRQPATLFSGLKEVLHLANGRSLHEGAAPEPAIVSAAAFFVRVALLHPHANHYQRLGLEPGADAVLIKDRYRLMMRLLHPDFAAQTATAKWPADAATLVNQAYEVLSSEQRRRQYDETLNPSTGARAGAKPAERPVPTRDMQAAQGSAMKARQGLRWLATAFGGLGALAAVGLWLAGGISDRETLVQRPGEKARIPVIAALPSKLLPVPEAVASASLFSSAQPQMLGQQAAESRATFAVESPPLPLIPAPVSKPEAGAATRRPGITDGAATTTVDAVGATPFALAPGTGEPVVTATISPPAARPTSIVSAAGSAQAATAAPAHPSAPSAVPVPTMGEVQPLLVRLLQQVESGWGERLLTQLDRDARGSGAAQALVQHYNGLVDGARPIQLGKVDLKGQPRPDRLVVTGHVVLQVRDTSAPTRDLRMQAEFVLRDGAPMLTRLSRAPD